MPASLSGGASAGGPALAGGRSKGVTLRNPEPGSLVMLWRPDQQVTVAEVFSIVAGSSPSVTFSVRHGTELGGSSSELISGGSTVTDTATGLVQTALDNPVIPAGHLVWLQVVAIVNTVEQFHLQLLLG